MDLSNENVVHIKKDGIEFLQFRKLVEYKEIRHAYTLGLDKNFRTAKANMVKLDEKEYEKAIADYKNICKEIWKYRCSYYKSKKYIAINNKCGLYIIIILWPCEKGDRKYTFWLERYTSKNFS